MVAKLPNHVIPSAQEEISSAKSQENQLDQHEMNRQMAFPIKGGGSVHEEITEAAANFVGINYTAALKRGVRWPDVPSEKEGETNYLGLRNINKPGTITYESHNGAKQFWHSMAPSDAQYTNGQVLDKIIGQAVAWYGVGKSENNEFYLGHILHMVQDSYSPAHVVRDENEAVVSFQAYDKQDHSKHKHGEAKEWVEVGRDSQGQVQMQQQTWQEVPGAIQAYRASVKIMQMYKDNASPEELRNFLREDVYKFHNEQTRDKPAGEIDPKYAPKEKTRITDAPLDDSEKYTLMVKAYLEKSPEDAVAAYPDLMHVHAKKVAISTQIADMPERSRAYVLASFDRVAVKEISLGKIELAETTATSVSTTPHHASLTNQTSLER
jgi:hypothetical protein